MLRNLTAEIARNGITNRQIAASINRSPASVGNKIYENTDFTFREAAIIHETFFPEKDIIELFKSED